MIYFYQSVFYAGKPSDIGERVSGKLRIHGRHRILISVLRAAGLQPKVFPWFVRPLLSAVFMGLWCRLFFRVLLGAGCPEGLACVLTALLGLVLYAAALLAQGLSVTDVLPSRRKQKAARG